MRAKRNSWYAAALASEVPTGAMVERTVLEETLLLFRSDNGQVSAIGGICPHRFAPLARGRVINGTIECGYHGLRFNGQGQCVHNPRGHGRITNGIRVKSYPLLERHKSLWIWMGESDLANPDSLPDLSFVDDTPDTMRVEGHLVSDANYEVIVDNLLDPSHADYMHASLLTSYGLFSKTAPKIERDDRAIAGIWAYKDHKSQPGFQMAQLDPESLTDQWHSFKWHVPSIVEIAEIVREPGNIRELRTRSFHAITPIDERRSYYWFIVCRNFADHGREFNEAAKMSVLAAFVDEDRPMLEAINKTMAGRDFWSMQPAILDGDQVSTLARRHLEKLIREEVAGATSNRTISHASD